MFLHVPSYGFGTAMSFYLPTVFIVWMYAKAMAGRLNRRFAWVHDLSGAILFPNPGYCIEQRIGQIDQRFAAKKSNKNGR